jgi:hypothetical protein
MQKLSADLEWDEGREKWEGEAPAEPKRQRLANSEWRTVNGKWRVANSKLVFPKGRLHSAPSTSHSAPDLGLLPFLPIAATSAIILSEVGHSTERRWSFVTYHRLKPTACPCADEHRASALMGACLPSAVSQRPPPNSAGGWVTVMSGRPRPAHRPSARLRRHDCPPPAGKQPFLSRKGECLTARWAKI